MFIEVKKYLLVKFVTETHLSGNLIQLWKFPSYELQMQHQFTVACSWAILLKPWGMASPF
jgi:hypothetical protein